MDLNRMSIFELNQGYSLRDFDKFDDITNLDFDVGAEAHVKVPNTPDVTTHYFRNPNMFDIAPHCRNLKKLKFSAKPNNVGVDYAPLAELPNLEEITISKASENGVLLSIFEAVTKGNRPPGLQPLKITFSEDLPHLSYVYVARADSGLKLNLTHAPTGTHLSASYDFWDISTDSSPLELTTIQLIEAKLKIDYTGLTLYKCPKSVADVIGFINILKLFNIKSLHFEDEDHLHLHHKDEIAKLIALIILDKSLALKSINIHSTEIDQSVTSELVKIKSITSLNCKFYDWESVELLSALTNLETVNVKVERRFNSTTSQAICSLINTCSTSGVIQCFDRWRIEFRNFESIISRQKKRITALKIYAEGEALSHIFEAFRSYSNLITIEKLDVLKCVDIKIKDLVEMAEAHPIQKLRFSLADTDNIEHFSDLAELGALEELTIHDSIKGSLTELFKQMKWIYSPQCLEINSKKLLSEELIQVSELSLLKKLDLCDSEPEDCESLMELANTDIEELTIAKPQFSLQKLFSAFAKKTTSRLQHLKIKVKQNQCLQLKETEELSKIQSLKSLQCTCSQDNFDFLLNLRHLVELDITLNYVTSKEALRNLTELEKLESLTLRLNLPQNYDILADIQNLKELNLLVDKYVNVNLTNAYQAIVRKNVKLTHLTTSIGCVEELNEITQIKTLRELHLLVGSIGKKITCLGELSELESLQITVGVGRDFIMGNVLPILRCCRNLDRLLIDSKYYISYPESIDLDPTVQGPYLDRLLIDLEYYLKNIYTHLKSIRDPTVQGPLTVILTEEYNIPDILVVLYENVYFKLFTSTSLLKR